MGGKFWYWGGFTDLERSLNRRGCKVVTAAVGPFSSVWDRAVELFYQIKGGTVDYGKEHSARHGHARFGRTFPGLYPAWDAQHPVSRRPCLRVRAGGRARLERACQTCARPAKP